MYPGGCPGHCAPPVSTLDSSASDQNAGHPLLFALATSSGLNLNSASIYAPPPKAVPTNFAELRAGVAVINSPPGPVVSPASVTEPSGLSVIAEIFVWRPNKFHGYQEYPALPELARSTLEEVKFVEKVLTV